MSDRSPGDGQAEPYRLQIEDNRQAVAPLGPSWAARYEQAMALFDAADEASWREALRIFTELGASCTGITRHKMRKLGIQSIPARAATATRAHPLGLTRREREVLG